MSKHTPGPWTWSEPAGAGIEVRAPYRESTRLIFTDIWRQFPEPAWDEEMRANARLISAAPDLLDAAKHCESLLMAHEINRINGEEIADAALNVVRTAIAKATGGDA